MAQCFLAKSGGGSSLSNLSFITKIDVAKGGGSKNYTFTKKYKYVFVVLLATNAGSNSSNAQSSAKITQIVGREIINDEYSNGWNGNFGSGTVYVNGYTAIGVFENVSPNETLTLSITYAGQIYIYGIE